MLCLRRMKADAHTVKDIARFLGVSKATCYRYLAEADEDRRVLEGGLLGRAA